MKSTGWQQALKVAGGGTGVVSHAGVALVRALADNTGLTAGLSGALADERMLIHDPGAGCWPTWPARSPTDVQADVRPDN